MPARALALLLLTLASGCSTIRSATQDPTELEGDVPAGLGRILEVEVRGADERLRIDLLRVLETEFESRDLFDHLEEAAAEPPGGVRQASRLQVELTSQAVEDFYDFWELQHAYVVRYELEVSLRDPGQHEVLRGHVTGLGVDAVTDAEFLDDVRREDVRLSALQDAGMKLSRGLRLAGDTRARRASEAIQPLELAAGVGPLGIAVLGADDPPTTPLRRGPILAEQLRRACERLGPQVRVTLADEVRRACEQAAPGTAFADYGKHEVQRLAQLLPARVFVVARVSRVGGRLTCETWAYDRAGQSLFQETRHVDGLGAVGVAAAEVAQALGQALQSAPPPP